ncbi:MAG: 4a-hydroxytetrahydrobiopterin dehydratase [Rhodobacteraceae bacterium]|nr:4a-hydroxytetrahydrobiopterin dehydratase [Paracoccaceae bacterium]|tara:strand:+ start:272 stop:577 length:306 start_codon:yes stop_codon:yes gene_type:complete
MNKKVNENNLTKLVEVDWKLLSDRNAISKTYKFKNFNEAFAFMTSVAIFADKINHHPEWFNVYSRVDVVLTTHDLNGVSELDITLAEHMDNFASNFLLDRV